MNPSSSDTIFTPCNCAATPVSAIKIGEPVFIQTVTYLYTGRVKTINLPAKEIVLTEAAWIADSGRFADAMETGNFSEIEPYPKDYRLIINTEAIVDKVRVSFCLPRVQK